MLRSGDGSVEMGLDISGFNHRMAWLSILLTFFVITELAACIQVIHVIYFPPKAV